MGQWNNFEAPQYNPNRHNLDPLMNQESMEAGIEQRVEQLPNNMNLVNQGPPNAYDNANMMGNAGLTATGFSIIRGDSAGATGGSSDSG